MPLRDTQPAICITVPPEEPIISYRYPQSSQQHLKGLIGPFDEGQRLVLLCTTFGGKLIMFPASLQTADISLTTFAGKPRPTLTWWKDYTVIDDTFEYKSKDGNHIFTFIKSSITDLLFVCSDNQRTGDRLARPSPPFVNFYVPSIKQQHNSCIKCQYQIRYEL